MQYWLFGTDKDTRASCHCLPGGTAVSGPGGLGAVQDALGTLPPQGPGAPRLQRAHPRESRGRVRPQRMWLKVGISQRGKAEGKGRQDRWGEVGGLRCLWTGGRAGQHSWEKQPGGRQQREQMEQVSRGTCNQSSRDATRLGAKPHLANFQRTSYSERI